MMTQRIVKFLPVAIALLFAGAAHAADWTVARSSGEVTVIQEGARPVALDSEGTIRAGDRIVTGPNGRVMLVRGQESIIVSPETELIIPSLSGNNGRTTLLESRGEAAFEVEKRNVQHFEVETPFLAAVVKGTKFVVKVDSAGARVNVERGVVEVFDFDTGQVGLVKAGQFATTSNASGAGLELGGSGELSNLEQRTPRKSRLDPDAPAEREASNGLSKGLIKQASLAEDAPGRRAMGQANAGSGQFVKAGNGIRIGKPIGERALAIGKLSNGLASSSKGRANGKANKTGEVELALAEDDAGASADDGNGNGLTLDATAAASSAGSATAGTTSSATSLVLPTASAAAIANANANSAVISGISGNAKGKKK